MKLLLKELDNRLSVKADRSIKADGVNGIMSFGENNDYPQRMERLILGSVTAKSTANSYAKFLSGDGFNNEEINRVVVGKDPRGKKITLKRLLSQVAQSLSFYNGAYVHVNLNLDRKVTDSSLRLFKNCRFSKLDDEGYTAKIGYYNNWEKDTKDKKYNKSNIKWYNVFNLDDAAFTSQIKTAEGIENFKGQLYFLFLDNHYAYPLSPLDAAYIDCDTENQLALHKNNEIRNGFSKKTIFQINETLDDTLKGEMAEGIKGFMGSRGDKALVIETDTDESGNIMENKAMKVDSIESNVDSKMFENWEKELANNIRKPITIPAILIDYEESALGSTSGEAIMQATNFFNQVTKDDRAAISEMFKEIFSNFDDEILSKNLDWTIKPLSLYDATNIQPTAVN